MEYIIISEIGVINFTQKVNEAIANGYEPVGGATLSFHLLDDEWAYWYTQALIRKPE